MKNRILRATLITLSIVVLVLSIGTAVAAAGNGPAGGNTGQVQITPLSEEEINWLTFMREEEKLARDVYLELFDEWQLPIFENIAASEQRHMDSIENLLDKYGLEDPVTDEEIRGGFTNDELELMYNSLIEKGMLSLEDAIEVGVMIEEADIADLEEALAVTTHTDIERVYTNLLRGSNNHLTAFNSHLD